MINRPLSLRHLYCVRVAAALTLFRLPQLERILRAGMKQKQLPRDFFSEILIHLSLTVGFPAMLEGLGRLEKVAPPARALKEKSGSAHNGRKIFQRIYGAQSSKLLANLAKLRPELPRWILNDTYGKVFARRGLTLQEREILNIAALSLQGLEKQLYSHLRGALRVGLSKRQIQLVLKETERTSGENLRQHVVALHSIPSR